MANINLSVGQINITGDLIVIARKVSTPLVEETREVYPSPLASSFNVVLPSSGDIDPVNYYVDFYESSDGVTLDLLLAQFVVKAKSDLIAQEVRFYDVGGSGDNDPAPDQDTLNDPYLDGKAISEVYIDGVGRPLAPPDYSYKEYDLVSGGGIQLLNGRLFSFGEKVAIVISYLIEQTSGSGGGGSNMYSSVVTITEDTTLGSTHRGKRLRCVGDSDRLVITLEDVTAVPDGTYYHITQNDGNQFQTRILADTGQSIQYAGETYAEISISKGEYIRIEKTGSIWEAVLVHQGVLMVGERFAGTWNGHPNTKPENGALYDGDDWPRIWYWLENYLPSTHKVVDDNVTSGGYTHPAGKEGLFVVHSTQKKFRVPNTQGWSERGLANFSAFNGDSTRTYDYPGGTQPEKVGQHRHLSFHNNGTTNTGTALSGTNFPEKRQGAGAGIGNTNAEYNICASGNEPDVGLSGIPKTTAGAAISGDQAVKNVGVVYLRRF
jgi:hypothetical protein